MTNFEMPQFLKPDHEDAELHYIGEALPKPSSVSDLGDTSTVGDSPFPARMDHVHSLVPVSATFTPTLTNIAIGTNGGATNTATYWYLGKYLYVEGLIIFGTTAPTLPGDAYVDLPSGYTMDHSTTSTPPLLSEIEYHDGATGCPGYFRISDANTLRFMTHDSAGTYVRNVGLAAAIPFAWGTQDQIRYKYLAIVTRA